eukprot:m.28816 g.28816  ORF g.28816 m.28816 type:complete len:471 (-) comp10340_c0_seq1:1196-2608(-)
MSTAHKEDIYECEFIKDRLYFCTLRVRPQNTPSRLFFSVDDELVYINFLADFGPLNLSMLYKFCTKLFALMTSPEHAHKTIHYYTIYDVHKRANAAYLISAFALIYLGRSPSEAHRPLENITPPILPFRDASYGSCTYKLTTLDCLRGLFQALVHKMFDFTTFNPKEYEFYERVENGDLNWTLPGKFISFAGPHDRHCVEDGYTLLAPENYLDVFKKYGVSDIVRLNKKLYDRERFTKHGFQHHDLFFVDGSTPSRDILDAFLDLSEAATGAVAVHCKAGLGRTGTLIACYMMKHLRMTAPECISWLRVARPGSVIGPQQYYLEDMQQAMWDLGEALGVQRLTVENAVRPAWAEAARAALQSQLSAERTELLAAEVGSKLNLAHPNTNPSPSLLRKQMTAAERAAGDELLHKMGASAPSQGDLLVAQKVLRSQNSNTSVVINGRPAGLTSLPLRIGNLSLTQHSALKTKV